MNGIELIIATRAIHLQASVCRLLAALGITECMIMAALNYHGIHLYVPLSLTMALNVYEYCFIHSKRKKLDAEMAERLISFNQDEDTIEMGEFDLGDISGGGVSNMSAVSELQLCRQHENAFSREDKIEDLDKSQHVDNGNV